MIKKKTFEQREIEHGRILKKIETAKINLNSADKTIPLLKDVKYKTDKQLIMLIQRDITKAYDRLNVLFERLERSYDRSLSNKPSFR